MNREANLDDSILDALRDGSAPYVSGEELCRLAGVSRTAIWKRIEKLRSDGYDIEATPHLGYRLTSVPDSLIPSEIKWKLGTHILGCEIISYKKTDSTNVKAYELAEQGLREGSVILADEQAKGKGRHGRSWFSPPGAGVYMSCILRPEMTPAEIPKITLIAAVAVARAIRSVTGLDATIKWPNDIIICGKKVCGILTEMKAEQDRIDFIILGIGVNVNHAGGELPSTGTTLAGESAASGMDGAVSRIEIVRTILRTLEKYYIILKNKGSGSIIEEWKELSSMIGSRVRVSMQNRSFDATAHNLDPDGSLIVRHDSGLLEKISSGDVMMVRQ